jgi:hypothetical protein
MYRRLTGLGEEGAEALVRVGGLALFGEESIRLRKQSVESGQDGEVSVRAYLDPVLEAVELQGGPKSVAVLPGPVTTGTMFLKVNLTSQQELAIWQPAWPTIEIAVS